ncbi:type VII secretion target [Mycobacterium sp. NPDC048908]|uniref:type VII secretion target n=1 Tax=Mycobacterium sp. NPDC048908 TaxID=3364292 RepID=UPI00371AF9A3
MTGALGVDAAALEAVARDFAQLSDELTRSATVHESAPVADQPSGEAVSELTASADHMVKTCADHLLGLADSLAAAARAYRSADAHGADRLSTTMPR